jgi:hypothetical protein
MFTELNHSITDLATRQLLMRIRRDHLLRLIGMDSVNARSFATVGAILGLTANVQ